MNEYTGKKILALSWKQPYGTLMLHEKIETRTWPTNYRGLVLICTSKAMYPSRTVLNIAGQKQFSRIMNLLSEKEEKDFHLQLGKAIAIGELVDSRLMKLTDEEKCFVQYHEPWKELRKMKDGTIKEVEVKLYCHIYRNVKRIEPFSWTGTQGWRELEQYEKEKIKLI